MASRTLLIAGRGPVALFATRLALSRGYRPTLLFDPAPVPPFLLLGVAPGDGLGAAFAREAGGLRDSESGETGKPCFLYLGEIHRILGCAPRESGFFPEEEDRFFPGLRPLISTVLPELEKRIDESFRTAGTFFPWSRRLMNWILEPERKKESLPGKTTKSAEPFLSPWRPLLGDLAPFSGLSSRKATDPEPVRSLLHLALSRARLIPGSPGITEKEGADLPPGTGAIPWMGEPVALSRKGRDGRIVIRRGDGPEEIFDRLLDLTGSPEIPLLEATCEVDTAMMPSLWPPVLLHSSGSGRSLLILSPDEKGDPHPGTKEGRTGRMVVAASPGEAAEGGKQGDWAPGWIGRWNGQSMFPFLRPDRVRFRREGNLLSRLADLPLPPRRTPNLRSSGREAILSDPSVLPVLTEDWLADLSLALPSRAPVSGF